MYRQGTKQRIVRSASPRSGRCGSTWRRAAGLVKTADRHGVRERGGKNCAGNALVHRQEICPPARPARESQPAHAAAQLRHAPALRRGDLRTVQEYLDMRDSTTQHYTHVDRDGSRRSTSSFTRANAEKKMNRRNGENREKFRCIFSVFSVPSCQIPILPLRPAASPAR